jgi:hypothetical protein
VLQSLKAFSSVLCGFRISPIVMHSTDRQRGFVRRAHLGSKHAYRPVLREVEGSSWSSHQYDPRALELSKYSSLFREDAAGRTGGLDDHMLSSAASQSLSVQDEPFHDRILRDGRTSLQQRSDFFGAQSRVNICKSLSDVK